MIMRTTIKSMAMVAIALFAGFGTASAQDEEEPVELTKDMFHVWDGLGKDAQPTDEKCYIDWKIAAGEACPGGSVVCGTSTVSENIYADLSGYSKMEICGQGASPRIMFNRTVKEGQQANGGMIEIKDRKFDEDGSIIIDLKKDLIRTVPDQEPTVDDFAHLVTIKAPWGGELTIDAIYLYKESGDATGIKDLQATDNSKVVATYNAAGAKVAANAKGLVIKKLQNGKVVKVINNK